VKVSQQDDVNGKNSVVGEFMLSFARAPEALQEAILVDAVKKMLPYYNGQIAPYPMLSHLVEILRQQGIIVDNSSEKESA